MLLLGFMDGFRLAEPTSDRLIGLGTPDVDIVPYTESKGG